MVRRKSALGRAAFTMIELIFAIVVISIAVITLPMMAQVTSKGIEDNIVQEAIFAASAELMGASAYYWDTRSIEDINVSGGERVIDVDGDCNPDRLRPGHVHRRCLDSNATSGVNYTTPETTGESLNRSVHDTTIDMFDNFNAEAAGYKQEYQSIMAISQINNNVKRLKCTILDANDNNLTTLSLFSANIGEVKYYKRRF